MDTYMHETMASVVSLEKIEIIRSEEFMLSEMRLKFLKKMIILGPKTAILGPQFCRILVLGPHFWWSEGAGPLAPPGSAPGWDTVCTDIDLVLNDRQFTQICPNLICQTQHLTCTLSWPVQY